MEYQPKNLDEALLQLSSLLSTDDLMIFRETPEEYIPAYFHHGLGRYLRNKWLLWWNYSPLAQYFNRLGITHPDDMSSVILLSFHRKLHNKHILLEQQIERL